MTEKSDNEHYREGYKDGYKDGVEAAREDARKFFEQVMQQGGMPTPPTMGPK